MTEKQAEREIKKLRKQIERHNQLYYLLNDPEISDIEYDLKLRRLEQLEREFPQFKIDSSPVDRVGSDLSSDAKTITHKVRMYSLDNAYSLDEVKTFLTKVHRMTKTDQISLFLEQKIDGFSINLYYEDGELKYAATRGDGFQGEDVTQNVKQIDSIPISLDYQKPIEVRGEIFLPIKEFFRINEERKKEGKKLFANPRNAAAGTIKLKESTLAAERKLDAIFYGVGVYDNTISKTQAGLIDFIAKLGFPTNQNNKLAESYNELIDYCTYWEANRSAL